MYDNILSILQQFWQFTAAGRNVKEKFGTADIA
jgi:hypothetical protein